MAVVGIDFGTLHSKIGVARNRGIDIIVNEVSNRATPSLVAFGQKQRDIGEAAKTQETSNFKNTIGSLKRLIGRNLQDPDVDIEKKFLNATLIDLGGTVATEVTYRGEKQVFTATQLVAMYFGKLRDITSNELKTVVSDLVIAVPPWFTDTQRRATIDAAQIANLNARLINDTTAVALSYGITKQDLPDPEKPRYVMFVDVGHSSMSASVVAFSKGQLTVKSTAYDRHLGGRDIDYALLTHFAAQFKSKYHIEVLSNPKATFRLAAGCEKLKKVLSANNEAPLNIEAIMNDIDVSSKLTRDAYEDLISNVLDRIAVPLQQALAESGITPESGNIVDAIDAVELVGGTTRIPAVRARIQSALSGKPLSTTLNQDEAIARGATFSAASHSPTFRVREFHTHDIAQYPIKVTWERSSPSVDPDDDTELVVFPRGNGVPSTKILTFYRKEPFEIDAQYVDPAGLPGGISPWIARFSAKAVPPDPNGDLTCVKLKTRLNLNGIMSFESAYTEDVEEREEKEEAMDVDGATAADGAAAASGEAAAVAPTKKKRVVKKHEIPISTTTSSLDSTVIEKLKEQEVQMHAVDRNVIETQDCKNALEAYVYDMRDKLDGHYALYAQPSEKEKLLRMFQEVEEWLYSSDGEDATKAAYEAKLGGLKAVGDAVVMRYRDAEERPRAMAQLRATLNEYISHATGSEDKYAHIGESDRQKVVEKCATVQKWLDDQNAKQDEQPKNRDPVLSAKEVGKKREEVVYFVVPILTKPKPKPAKVESNAGGGGAQTPQGGTQTPQSGGTQTPDHGGKAEQTPPNNNNKAEQEVPASSAPEMDVD